MNTKTVRGTYGSQYTPCDVFVYGDWYVVDGGTVVNQTWDGSYIEDGIDVETIEDIDCFTCSAPIESIEELVQAVDAD